MKYKEQIDATVPKDDSTSMAEKMLLYWLIRDYRPKTVIETGTHRGLTSLYMAHALYDNQYGHLTTCDPKDWAAPGNFAQFPELQPYITYLPIMGKELTVERVDFAFIDGFHGKLDVIEELDMLMPRLNKTAIIVFHDCWYTDWPGVNEALEEYGLKSLWLPTKNAIRIFCRRPKHPKGPEELW